MTLFIVSAFVSTGVFGLLLSLATRNIVAEPVLKQSKNRSPNNGPKAKTTNFQRAIEKVKSQVIRFEDPRENFILTYLRESYAILTVSVILGVMVAGLLIWAYAAAYYHDVPHTRFVRHLFYIAHSDDLREIVSGIVFGSVFAYWLRSIFRRSSQDIEYENQNRKTELVLGGILLLFLMYSLGSLGAISGILTQITATLPGGVAVSMTPNSNSKNSKDTALATLVPPSASSSSGFGAPDTSGGLRILRDLPGAIARDALYFVLRDELHNKNPEKVNNIKIIDGFITALNFSQKLNVARLAGCLDTYTSVYGDDGHTGDMTADIGRALRSLLLLQTSSNTIGGVEPLDVFAKSIESMVEQISYQIQKFDSSVFDTRNDELIACDYIASHKVEFSRKNVERTFSDDKQIRRRPYVWSAAAAALAYDHNYSAALVLLDFWLKAANGQCGDAPEVSSISRAQKNDNRRPNKYEGEKIRIENSNDSLHVICLELSGQIATADGFNAHVKDIFELRVRALIGSFLEEWISWNKAVDTASVRRYQLENLRLAIELIDNYASGSIPDLELTSDGLPEIDCSYFESEKWPTSPLSLEKILEVDRSLTPGKMRLGLFSTLISLKRDWIDTALNMDDYYKENYHLAKKFADELRKKNLYCLYLLAPTSPTSEFTEKERGQEIVAREWALNNHAYAKVVLKIATASFLDDVGEGKQQLGKALEYAKQSLEQINVFANKEIEKRGSVDNYFIEKISPNPTIEAHQRLLTTTIQLQEAYAR
jgi:hypothetical protein